MALPKNLGINNVTLSERKENLILCVKTKKRKFVSSFRGIVMDSSLVLKLLEYGRKIHLHIET